MSARPALLIPRTASLMLQNVPAADAAQKPAYPKQSPLSRQNQVLQKHDENLVSAMNTLVVSKVTAEHTASALPDRFARALQRSNRIMAEDLVRESGYMLPQSKNARKFLKGLAEAGNERAEKLLKLIKSNE